MAAGAGTYYALVTEFQHRLLVETLAASGNLSRAARALGINRTYLHRLIRERGIKNPGARRREAVAA